jgi:hypothetical protein
MQSRSFEYHCSPRDGRKLQRDLEEEERNSNSNMVNQSINDRWNSAKSFGKISNDRRKEGGKGHIFTA